MEQNGQSDLRKGHHHSGTCSYTLATECSSPNATNTVTGSQIAYTEESHLDQNQIHVLLRS